MSDEDRWAKLRQIIGEELDKRGFKVKTKLGFVNGQWTGITEDQLSAWRNAYGSVDIDAELKKMAAWILSNPHLAPKSNFARFVNTWISRQQTTASIRSIPTRRDGSTKPPANLCAYCLSPASGSANGYRHCSSRECWDRAMSNERPGKMPGQIAKQVAGG